MVPLFCIKREREKQNREGERRKEEKRERGGENLFIDSEKEFFAVEILCWLLVVS